MTIQKQMTRASKKRDELIAIDHLVSAKSLVRAYAVAVTEAASPKVRKTLTTQLNKAIQTHADIATYMIENDMYLAYDLEKQLKHDEEKMSQIQELVNDK